MVTADQQHRHPSTYSKAELEQMLRVERLAITQRVLVLKREIRANVEELEALERRLAEIDHAEGML